MIYNDFRPQRLGEVIGQEAPVRILGNQLRKKSLSNAYLFCGTRGTGKTTIARILAKACNCENPENGEPCMKCEACRLVQGGCPDIIELDGASNNSIEDIRDLICQARGLPLVLKKKVYIIDEAHMLSNSASNALLKTLEEPPEHVVFILCTTERHKILKTIASRCQKMDFRALSIVEIENNIKKILLSKGYQMDDDAIRLIAISGDGSMRDALSELEKCIESGCHRLEDVQKVEGMLSEDAFFEILKMYSEKNIYSMMTVFQAVRLNNLDIKYTKSKMLQILTDKLCILAGGRCIADLNMTAHYQKQVADLTLTNGDCLSLIEALNRDCFDIRYSLVSAMVHSNQVLIPESVTESETQNLRKMGIATSEEKSVQHEDPSQEDQTENYAINAESNLYNDAENPFDDEPDEEDAPVEKAPQITDPFAGFDMPFPL